MDNNIKQPSMDTTTNFINNTYDNLSYFDLYGNSVIIFIFITLFVFLVFSYCKVMQTKETIADDWVNQRCKPQNMPFAGFITHPEGVSAFQYTSDNFQYCIQSILKDVTGHALDPLHFMVSAITKIFEGFADSIQKLREVINKLREGIKEFAQDVLARILNVMIPIQKMFIALMDTFQKIQGVMTGSLYTMLGSYYTLQSLMGAIIELIVKILVALVIIVVGLWVMPFTWPAAAATSAIFLAISIPLGIIVYFMTEVLHIKSSAIPKLRCFDRKTKIFLIDQTFKFIEDIKPKDVLIDGSIVTAKIKVTSENLYMYNLNGIIVSESHVVKYCDKWIKVKNHPYAIKLDFYNEPYLYCLNTSTKTLHLNNVVYTDWDEVYGDNLTFLLNYNFTNRPENISMLVDSGYKKDTQIKLKCQDKSIKDIEIGDILITGGIVYGIVELEGNLGNRDNIYNLLVSNGIFQIDNTIHYDYNKNIDSILELRKILSK